MRLRETLGGTPDTLTAGDVETLVGNLVAESFDLDFKEQIYGGADSDKRSLCTDVAALANTAGGVIVIGIREDDHGRASSSTPVALSDAEVRRMRQIVANGVSPIPEMEIVSIEERDGKGFLLVVVAASSRAPHGVSVSDGWRYPQRNGSTTRYLSEPEVFQAYQHRIASSATRRARASEVFSHGVASLDRGDTVWVAVGMTPATPAVRRLDFESWRQWNGVWRTTRLATLFRSSHSIHRTRVGMGWFAADGGSEGPLARWVSWIDHIDGSGFVAFPVGRHREDRAGTPINDETLTEALITAIRLVGLAATQRAGVLGDVLMTAGVIGCTPSSPAQLVHSRGGFGADSWNEQVRTDDPEPFGWTATLDGITSGGPGLVSATALPLTVIGQAFGVPELPQLSADGEVRIRYFSREVQQSVKDWAGRSDVAGTEETPTAQ